MICCPKEQVPSNQVKLAKDAHTTFEFVGYPKDTAYSNEDGQSIVKCYPKTGRTH